MTDQGLWYGCVHCIHGHVVSVIGRPSKSKLGEVSCSDHNTAGLVCNVHQNLCTFACLSVLIGDIMYLRIMSDIAEMKIYRLTDIYLLKRCSKAFT